MIWWEITFKATSKKVCSKAVGGSFVTDCGTPDKKEYFSLLYK